jgi:amino acid transporter
LSLVAATFFVVSGGPYGLEEIVGGHGYLHTLALLIVVPCVWSLPIALLVGEMSSTLPQEGGYYAWVRRAMGPFWGMQVAWLALAMSLFDMAIYPTLLITYLGRLFPALQDTSLGGAGWLAGAGMIALCTLWNLRGSRAVGEGSIVLGAVLLSPFVILAGAGAWQLRHFNWSTVSSLLTTPPAGGDGSSSLWVSGVLLCMWNYMGWDNASTVAAEVERPQRTYPRAMALTVALVAGCYLLSVFFAMASNMPASAWTAGAWVEVGRRIGGPVLGTAIALGGALCGLGMFNVLVLSYSRLPMAMANDGMLPRWVGERSQHSGAPRRIILLSALLYVACMGLGFRRLVEIDVILYGAVITLQFGALILLRLREPNLVRPFRIPGGIFGLVLVALMPLGLLLLALWAGRNEPGMWGLSSIEIGGLIAVCGPLVYCLRMGAKWLSRPSGPKGDDVSPEADTAERAALSIS